MAIMSGRVLKEIDGVPSVVDADGTILAACTCHVDDMAISGPQKWLDEHYNAFVTKFKKVWCKVNFVARSNQSRSLKAERMMTSSTAKR